MDHRTEAEMKNLTFISIFTQSFASIFSNPKLFTQITLTFILPLATLFFAHIEISNHFFNRTEYYYDHQNVTLTYYLSFWLFKIIYFTLLVLFSLLSTAAVVFTVASVYTDRTDLSFRQVVNIVPKIWKNLCLTFVFIYLAVFVYNIIYGVVLFVVRSTLGFTYLGSGIMFVVMLLYLFGLLYLIVVWELASVVTVLENIRGFTAFKKGKYLADGKKKVGMGVAFVLYGFLLGVIVVYNMFVEFGDELFRLVMIWRVLIGVLCVLLATVLFLVIIVTQTVLYLVCKSYHREVIDKLGLSTFLSAYSAETVMIPKPGEEIQLGRAQPAQQV